MKNEGEFVKEEKEKTVEQNDEDKHRIKKERKSLLKTQKEQGGKGEQ